MQPKNQNKTIVSIIVPVFNERENVAELIKRIQKACEKAAITFEIIFIDDLSTDGTYDYLLRLKKYPFVKVFRKQKIRGKAYSLVEGFSYAVGQRIVMVDADLQYPPEQIPHMLAMLDHADVIVANRKQSGTPFMRKFCSKVFRVVFGKLLFGLPYDIQSGLKVFRREVIDTIHFTPFSAWTFDLEFLFRAKQAGFRIENYEIPFLRRKHGQSKINIIKAAYEIGSNAVYIKAKGARPQHIQPKNAESMLGAGVGYKSKKYITHTTLPYQHSALITFSNRQKIILAFLFLSFILSLLFFPLTTGRVIVAGLTGIYFVDFIFNLILMMRSLKKPEELVTDKKELKALSDASLPVYTILSPLYKEAHVIPQFLKAMDRMDYPKEKLDVMLLLEEDDIETIQAVDAMQLPSYVRKIVVPDSQPKTKPKACNYGLSLAKGEFLVIYDAEDIPDVLQLKKAYLTFKKLPGNVICLQAKLNYYNPHFNLLTRFFTAEYSLWFDMTLPGLQGINATIPLGGTSNHFRIADLRRIQGWDPFNVTEDADLGVRLYKDGYKTAIIDSTTLEEANSKVKNWFRQRSRWLKGYMQTYLVHMRSGANFSRQQHVHTLFLQLTVGGKLAFILINPFT